MRLSCALIFSFALAGTGAASAAGLDAPHTIHHSRSQHLVETHKTHHASAHATVHHSAKAAPKATAKAAPKTATARRTRHSAKAGNGAATIRRASLHGRRHYYGERFTASSFAGADQFSGDITTGEDPIVRQAAIDALGDMNGTAVVIDPSNGRILAMVNQKLALSPGAEPCSTIKITVAMAALSEGLVTRDTMVQLPGFRMNMTQALAKSNNLYFEELGRELGFERVKHYANEFGLGELAGWHIQGEQLGEYPDHPIPAAEGGVGKMCSFGQGVSMTPLQLGAYVAALANGGTLYYLQHPTTAADIAAFEPHVKRTLDIAKYVPELQDGMAGAVEYGTARRLRASFTELPVFGKTGTCSNNGTRFGWFASFSEAPQGSLVTVFFLEGGRPTFGPRAAELTGAFYRNLWDHNYFINKPVQATASATPAESTQGVEQ
ncbi:penicillin-binding transpeptidase domain-containing protein [Occallatibacter riparius]|uniref:Penicillin-binding protein n=1 Tax=Occallatibacter riparius TaxID=1002689 RepID=A0A9J7BH61_9BACT|nr:penicillin-binding transpeptidase domain-containing protein [Occallatibacter riparius]UWZ82120.1 penicillin-binding protein [Occallatibacter riparius]